MSQFWDTVQPGGTECCQIRQSGAKFDTVTQPELTLHWEPVAIAKFCSDNGIRNRQELASRLGRIGLSQATVYRAFTEDWQGRATITLLAALSWLFAVTVDQLITTPEGQP